MRMFFLCIFILISGVLSAQADTALEVFKREFIERYLETFYRGEPFDFEGLKCKGNPALDKYTNCVNAHGVAVIDVKNIDRRGEGGEAHLRAVTMAATEEPVLPELDWSVRGRADMDKIMDAIDDWAASKPSAKKRNRCAGSGEDGKDRMKVVRVSAFDIVSENGEDGFLLANIVSSNVGYILVFGFMRGEGFCEW